MQPTPLPLLTPRKRPTPTPPHLTPYPPKKLDTLLHTPYTSPMPNKKQDKRAQAKARAKIRRAEEALPPEAYREGRMVGMDLAATIRKKAGSSADVKAILEEEFTKRLEVPVSVELPKISIWQSICTKFKKAFGITHFVKPSNGPMTIKFLEDYRDECLKHETGGDCYCEYYQEGKKCAKCRAAEANHEEDLKELGQRTESANAFLNRNEVPPADILSRNQAIGLLAVAFIVVVIIAALYA